MKYSLSLILTVLTITSIYSQYTEVINSNRPGSSQGAFSVGKNVLQFELGGNFTDLSHKNLNYSYIKELELKYTIRYGLLMEKLERDSFHNFFDKKFIYHLMFSKEGGSIAARDWER